MENNVILKGDHVRVSGCNEAGQQFAPFEGVVLGVEFRTDPPVISVVDGNGKRHDVTNLRHGCEIERCS